MHLHMTIGSHRRPSATPSFTLTCRRPRWCPAQRPMAAASSSSQRDGPPALQEMDASSPAYAAVRQTQAAVMQVFTDHLLLAPASDGSANPGGKLEVASDDGSAAAAVQSYSGPGVRWLSSSALARPGMGFGGTIMQGFADGSSDVPHFLLEQTLFGGKVLLSLVLWPRRDWMLDDAYLQRYYGTAPPGCELTYNDLYNRTMAHPDWKLYQSPVLVVKPMMSAAFAFTFPPTEENLLLAQEAATGVALLWVSFLKQRQADGTKEQADEGVQLYDARYIQAVAEDPGNVMAARLFGEQNTNAIVKAMHGDATKEPLTF
ncbi:hypothetical protein D9Q98_008333 [Chlorella vulgaris]|uniref:Uncharacterized protein n=1 Tax=Chlorella vulgaris TaxID=3077 RepID=A0A9D4TGH9_CHLVU|nr:hypothetical protein D9Q98_008333 [Chlorella vulgaris]